MRTIKYSGADGTVLWQKRYNGPANRHDQALAVAVDGSGNVVVTGDSVVGFDSFGYPNSDYYTAKYAAADGALLWEKRYNGPANSGDRAMAVAVDGSGDVIVTGYSAGNLTGNDYYTAKYAAANGALLWEKRYDGPANIVDYATAVTLDGGGNVVVTGFSASGFDIFGNLITDYYTAKYAAADGALLWEQRYNGPADRDDQAQAVAVDSSGNVVVTGFSAGGFDNFGNQIRDYYTAKYAGADGALLWEQRYNGPANRDDQAQAVAVDGSGNVVVTGHATTGFDYNFGNQIRDYYTAKYAAADGALLWEKRHNGPAYSEDQARAVAVDGSGNVVVTGFSVGTNFNSDYYTAKYAVANGALLWEKRYNGPANSEDQATAVALDGSGNVVVTGYSYNGTNEVFYTAKYAAAEGALLWEKTSPGRASAIAVDGGGNVVVTGFVYAGRATDYYTVKYAAANGALLWEKRYNFPDGEGRSEDYATAVAVDGSGNAVVTGSSVGDAYTAKYGAANGALLWEKRYNGPANSEDQAQAVAVDGSGDVVVTGYSFSANFNSDFYTAKYAAANGALLWEKRYDGPANSDDFATAVALDSSGNVVVTGYPANGTNNVFYTAKYAAANGALLWEKHYNGGSSHGGATAVAVGPNGMVAIAGSSDGIFNSRTTSDYATVVYREIPPAISIAGDGTGGYFISGSGIAGSIFQLQRATSVTGPWTSNATITAASPGLIEFHDTNAPSGQAFYRTVQP